MHKLSYWPMAILLMMIFGSCSKTGNYQVEEVTSIVFETDSLTMEDGQTLSLQLSHLPSRAKAPEIEWTSSNTDVLTVEDGQVTTHYMGEAVVTAKVKNSPLRTSIKIKVNPGPNTIIPMEKIILSLYAPLPVGSSFEMSYQIMPENATDKTVTWTSSDETIATVSSMGIVKNLRRGSVRITASTVDGNVSSHTDILFNGSEAERIIFPAIRKSTVYPYIDTEESDGNLALATKVNERFNISFKVFPEDAFDRSIIWTVVDSEIGKMDDNGNFTGLKPGMTTVRATSSTNSEVFSEFTVRVSNNMSDFVDINLRKNLEVNSEGLTLGNLFIGFQIFHTTPFTNVRKISKIELLNSNGSILRSSNLEQTLAPNLNFTINLSNPVKDPSHLRFHISFGNETFIKTMPL